MKSKTIYRELFLIILTILPIVYLLINWSRLPDQVPIHFDLGGDPNGYGSKLIYIFLPIGIYLLMLVLPYIDPRKSNYDIFSDTYFKLRLVLSLFLGIVDTIIIYNTLHGIGKMGSLLPSVILLLFTLIGNYLGNVRPNYFIGIKCPWTLNSDEVWIRTHKLAGKLWFWVGLAGLVLLFIIKDSQMVLIPVILVITIIPVVYSYIIYQKITKK
jgi:uncharacterized membrane protein